MRHLILGPTALLGGLLCVGGCGISEEVYNRDIQALKDKLKATEDAHQTCQQALEQARADLDKTRQAQEACARELAAQQSKGGELDADLKKALTQLRKLQELFDAQQAVFSKLRTALDALVNAGKLKVAVVRGMFTVQMADKILFDSGSDSLKKEGEGTLVELAQILGTLEGRRFQVAGHTDADGDMDLNWRLSSRRAYAVTRVMIKAGMPPDGISFAGFGSWLPVAANDTPDGKAQNRRIEIVLIPDMEELMAPLMKGGVN
jgi:chemotaxis protein MotB